MKHIHMKQMQSYPRRLVTWFNAAWLPLATVLISVLAVSFAWFTPEYNRHDDDVRCLAVALQIIGWGGVFRGLLQTRAQFGFSPVGVAIMGWIKQFPMLFPKPVQVSVNATATGVGSAGGIETSFKIDENAPLEKQMRAVISNINLLQDENRALRKDLKLLRGELKDAINEERRKRTDEIAIVRSTLVEHATGGLKLTLCGALFFLVGGVLGTLPYRLF